MEPSKEELMDVLKWCKDNAVAPGVPDEEGILFDMGCGCCADDITVPDNIRKTLEEVFK